MEVKIKPQKDFPLLAEYQEVFNTTDKTIFAYKDTIYTNDKLPEHLIVHEIEHLKQQERYGLTKWVQEYLYDRGFRLKMEIEAYREQLKSIKDRNFRAKILMESARTLSSDLYGNIIDYGEAIKRLKV